MTPEQENKLHTQFDQGRRVAAELNETGSAFAKLREEYTAAWLGSDPRDTAGREKLWIATTILTKVEEQLRQVVITGKIAEKQIEALRKTGEPPKKLFGII